MSYYAKFQEETTKNSSNPVQVAASIGLSVGLLGSAAYYFFSKGGNQLTQKQLFMKELLNDLRQHSCEPKKEGYFFTKDFMILLFKIMYTYQTIGAEVVKEDLFERRIEALRTQDQKAYTKLVLDSQTEQTEIKIEVKNIVFDYFNIIVKEYEIAYTRYNKDKDYIEEISRIQDEIDKEYVATKYVSPEELTKEKATEILTERSKKYRGQILQSIQMMQNSQGGDLEGQIALATIQIDDSIYLNSGYRKEELLKAKEKYQIEI